MSRQNHDLDVATAKLAPLQEADKLATEKVNSLMRDFQDLSGVEAPAKKTRGGKGSKRGPRSISAIISTSSTRLLRSLHKDGKAKKAALAEVLTNAEKLCSDRKESFTSDLKALVSSKADEIWKG